MNILGFSCYYHDAAATLLKDGKIVAAVQEERFTRKKHDQSFPINAINYCLKEAGITINELDYIGFYEKPMLKFERILYQHIHAFPKSFPTFIKTLPNFLGEKIRIHGVVKKKLKYKGDIIFIDHHLSHAASCYLVSPFKKAAIVTLDGVGEWATTTYGYGRGNDIVLLKEIRFPHSIGLLYSAITAYLGFTVNNSEYKVMGLAAYGEPTYYDKFKKLIDIKEDGSYLIDMDYFDYHYKMTMPGKKFIREFGPIRKPNGDVTQRHKDIASSLQIVLEENVIKILNHVYKQTKMDNLCMAGGVALNSVANGKILKSTKFDDIFIQPAAGDAGGSMGVATYIYNTILDKNRVYKLDSAYLGPTYSTQYIENLLKQKNIMYKTFNSEKEIVKATAKLIFENKIVGWFQGRMEWGPRALGSRSILANPTNLQMKDIINMKVKHREKFRPFAPVIAVEDAEKYFECDSPVPLPTDFMLMVYPIKKDKQSLIPAVTHIDGTGRLQTIRSYKRIRKTKRSTYTDKHIIQYKRRTYSVHTRRRLQVYDGNRHRLFSD